MRVPWAPLNFGVFLIIFGGLILTSLLGVIPLAPLNALPEAPGASGVHGAGSGRRVPLLRAGSGRRSSSQCPGRDSNPHGCNPTGS